MNIGFNDTSGSDVTDAHIVKANNGAPNLCSPSGERDFLVDTDPSVC